LAKQKVATLRRLFVNLSPSQLMYYARRYADAVTQLKRVVAMDEKFNTAYNWLVVALEMQGKYPEAFEWLMKGRARNLPDPDQQKITQALQAAYQTSGWQGMQLEYIRRFEEGKTDKIPYPRRGAKNVAKIPAVPSYPTSALIRAGILCAVISASTRSLPQPRLLSR